MIHRRQIEQRLKGAFGYCAAVHVRDPADASVVEGRQRHRTTSAAPAVMNDEQPRAERTRQIGGTVDDLASAVGCGRLPCDRDMDRRTGPAHVDAGQPVAGADGRGWSWQPSRLTETLTSLSFLC